MIQHLNEFITPALLFALGAGMLLGVFFFGGLWWTVKKMQTTWQPALWFFTGFVLRMSIMTYGIYWVSDAQWQRLLACILGVLLARFAIIRLTDSCEKNTPVAKNSVLVEPYKSDTN